MLMSAAGQPSAATTAVEATSATPGVHEGARRGHATTLLEPSSAQRASRASRSTSASRHSTPRAAPHASGSTFSAGVGEQTQRPAVVLTPTHLRIVSKTLLWHTTCCWLTNAVFVGLLLGKLDGSLALVSWWVIFCPMWLQHAVYIPLQVLVIMERHATIYRQIGPAPPATASSGLQLQYAVLHTTRMRTHVLDAVSAILDSLAMLASKLLFCWCLAADGGFSGMPLRLVLTPLWVGWVLATIVTCMKDRADRLFGSTRDLINVFLVFVAVKVDGQVDFSWSIVFVVPWMYFSAIFLIALVVLVVLLFARVWARARELLLPLGFFLLLASTAPQFASYISLVELLDHSVDPLPTLQQILIPNIVSWCCMWASSLLLAWGLRQKERTRDALLASGAVWTMHEQVARRLRTQDQDALRAKIDRMSDEEVAALVAEAMAGKPKPQTLMRIGNTLYKRCDAGQEAGQEAGQGEGQAGECGVRPIDGQWGRAVEPAGLGRGMQQGKERAEGIERQEGVELGQGWLRHKEGEEEGSGREGSVALLHTSTELPSTNCNMVVEAWELENSHSGQGLFLRQGESTAVRQEAEGGAEMAAGTAAGAGTQAARGASKGAPGPGEVGVEGAGPESVCVVVLSGDGDTSSHTHAQPSNEEEEEELREGCSSQSSQSSELTTWPVAPAAASAAATTTAAASATTTAAAAATTTVAAAATTTATAATTTAAVATDLAAATASSAASNDSSSDGACSSSDGGRTGCSSGGSGGGGGGGGGVGAPGAPDRQSRLSPTMLSVWDTIMGPHKALGPQTLPGQEEGQRGQQQQQQLQQQQQGQQGQQQGQHDGRHQRQDQAQQGQGGVPSALPHVTLTLHTSADPLRSDDDLQPPRHTSPQALHTRPSLPPSPPSIPLPHLVSGPLDLEAEVDRNLGLEGIAQSLDPETLASHPWASQGLPAHCNAASGAAAGQGAGPEAGAEAGAGAGASSVPIDAADDTCIICYDGTATCVFLDCGHGGFCQRCAYLLYVRPPSECPTCRAHIEQVVRLEEVRSVGQVCAVRN